MGRMNITMTAAKIINYTRTSTFRSSRDDSSVSLVARAIGADEATLLSLIIRLKELKSVKTLTLIEINGIEADYINKKKCIDRFLKYLKRLSGKNKFLKFTVRIGNMVYPI